MKCALCDGEKELKNSHIIPEFFYKPLYDHKHRINVLPLTENEKNRYEQKGLREKLLCGDCELQISRYEDHVRKIFYGGTGIFITKGNPIKISGIDYKKFKLFQLSLLFRAAVSKLDFFHNVTLGPHEKEIKEMIRTENPGGKLDYPCLVILMLIERNIIIDELIYPPQYLRIDGHQSFRFLLGGCFWIYYVSSHTNRIRFPEFILSELGEIKIPLKKAEETEFFQKVAGKLLKYNKK
jgi:hypothetical protein